MTTRITKFGKWEVKPDGEMVFDNYYEIGADELTEKDWILHLSTKGWIDWNDFIPAYLKALKNAKIPKVTILTYYDNQHRGESREASSKVPVNPGE
jgi:poly-D-alanine transfer protein DltD